MNKQDYERKIKALDAIGKIEGIDYKASNDGKGSYSLDPINNNNYSDASTQAKEVEKPNFSDAHPYLDTFLKYAPDALSILPYLIAPEVAIPARLGTAAIKYLPRIWNTIKLAGASGAVAGLSQKGINTAEETAGYKPSKNATDNFIETTAFNLATPAAISAAKGIGKGIYRELGLGKSNTKLAQQAINNLANNTLEKGGVALTPSQLQNSPRLATLEQKARTGKYGEETQNIIRNLDNVQERSVANNFKQAANLPLKEEISGQSINSRVKNIYNSFKDAVEKKEKEYDDLYKLAEPHLSNASIDTGTLSRIRDNTLNPLGYNKDAINQILLGNTTSIDRKFVNELASTLSPGGVTNIQGIRLFYPRIKDYYKTALKMGDDAAKVNINNISNALREETSKVIQEHPNISPEAKNAVAVADNLYKVHKNKTNGSAIYDALKKGKAPEKVVEFLLDEDHTTASKAIQDFNKFIDKDHQAFNDLKTLHLLNHGTKVDNGRYVINAENLVNNLAKNRGSSTANALFSEEEQQGLDNFADNISQTLRSQLPYQEQSIGSNIAHALPYKGSNVDNFFSIFNKGSERNALLNAIQELGNTQKSSTKGSNLLKAALVGGSNNLAKEVVLNLPGVKKEQK